MHPTPALPTDPIGGKVVTVDPRNLAELRAALKDNPDALDVLAAFSAGPMDDPEDLINLCVDNWAASDELPNGR
jgi:hypothetical protein